MHQWPTCYIAEGKFPLLYADLIHCVISLFFYKRFEEITFVSVGQRLVKIVGERRVVGKLDVNALADRPWASNSANYTMDNCLHVSAESP